MMDRWIVIARWDEFQHRDMARSEVPPWIKNYTKLMSDDAYLGLTAAERGVLHGLWLEYARARRALGGDTASITRRLGVRVTEKTLARLNHAGFIEFSASEHAGKVAGTEVEVEKKNPYIPLKTKPAKHSAQQQLKAAAQRYVDNWNGGPSDAFDAGLDELEQLTGARLEAGDRYRLWDKALHHGQMH